MPPFALTQAKYAFAVFGMSVKSVPGCFVAIPPSLIGVPLAFWPLPSPHFDAAAAGSLEALVELADDAPAFELDELLLSLPPQAATRNARATAAAAIAGAERILCIAPPPSYGFTGASRRGPRAPAAGRLRPAGRAWRGPPPRSRRAPAGTRLRAAG